MIDPRFVTDHQAAHDQARRGWIRSHLIMAVVYLLAALACVLMVLFAPAPAIAATPEQAASVAAPPAAAARYRRELVRAAHAQWGLDAPIAVLAAQVHQESAWRPDAVSRVGAQGLAQFMPATARWWCQREAISTAECLPTNPVWALRALVGYDRFLFDRAPAYMDARDRMWLALRGYNGGEGHWRAEGARTGRTHPTREQIDAACGTARRSPVHCPENLGYPARILGVLQARYLAWGPGL